jgi:hypothetical protein
MTTRVVAERCIEIQKSEKKWIRVHLIKPGEEDYPGLDVREFIESESYTGRTKKGVRIPESMLPEFVAALRELDVVEKRQGM